MEWMVRNLYTKSHLLSECLTCISALPLQREHKLNLRRCLVSFRDEMTTKERLTVIHCLFSIIESKQEYSLCDLLFSLLFSVSFQDLAPSIGFMTSVLQKKRCLAHPLLSLLVLLDALMDTILVKPLTVDSFLLLLSLASQPSLSSCQSALRLLLRYDSLSPTLLSTAMHSSSLQTPVLLRCMLQHCASLPNDDINWRQFIPRDAQQLQRILETLFCLCEEPCNSSEQLRVQKRATTFLTFVFAQFRLNPQLILCRFQLGLHSPPHETVLAYAGIVCASANDALILQSLQEALYRFDEPYLLFCLVLLSEYCKQGVKQEHVPLIRSFLEPFSFWRLLPFQLFYTRCCMRLPSEVCVYRPPFWCVCEDGSIDLVPAISFFRSVLKGSFDSLSKDNSLLFSNDYSLPLSKDNSPSLSTDTLTTLCTVEAMSEIIVDAFLHHNPSCANIQFHRDADDDELSTVFQLEVTSRLLTKRLEQSVMLQLLESVDVDLHMTEDWRQHCGWFEVAWLSTALPVIGSVTEGERRMMALLVHGVRRGKVSVDALTEPSFLSFLTHFVLDALRGKETQNGDSSTPQRCDSALFLLHLTRNNLQSFITQLPTEAPHAHPQEQFLLSLLHGAQHEDMLLSAIQRYTDTFIASSFLYDDRFSQWSHIPVNVALTIHALTQPASFMGLIGLKRRIVEEEAPLSEEKDAEATDEAKGDRKRRRKMQFEKMLNQIGVIAKRNAARGVNRDGEFAFVSSANGMEVVHFVLSELMERARTDDKIVWVEVVLRWIVEGNMEMVVRGLKQDREMKEKVTDVLEGVELILKRLEDRIDYYGNEVSSFLAAVEESIQFLKEVYPSGKLSKILSSCDSILSSVKSINGLNDLNA